jgi:Uma2 family endonuclease
MMATSLEHSPLTQPKTGEKRVVFHGLNWQRYQQILQALGEHRSARLTYDEGTLEITMPLEDHDYAVRLIELFIRVLVVEMGLKIKTMGSTTLDREDLDRGSEPDGGYYIKNQPLVKGRNVDLSKDPPPDLIVEVDITHSDINKFRLYAKMGIPEFWRYDGQVLRVYQLQEEEYFEADVSPTFPTVPKTKLYEFLEQAREDEVEAELALREWVRSQASI